jgi:hypothetical protein
MSEQIINITATQHFCNSFRHMRAVVVIIACLSVSGCIPQGEEHVNAELFKDRTEVTARTETIKTGMKKKDVFEKLKVNPARFERMSLSEVQLALYGNSQVHGTPAQLEAFRRKLATYDGYTLPYRNISCSSSAATG